MKPFIVIGILVNASNVVFNKIFVVDLGWVCDVSCLMMLIRA